MQTRSSIILLGVLGADPKVEEAKSSGRLFTTFSVAVDQNETTTWYRCVVFGQGGENAARLLRKGTGVQILGTLNPATVYTSGGQVRVNQNVTVDQFSIVTQPRNTTTEGTREETTAESEISDIE